ncbi:DNA repair protein RadA [Thermodesulfobacterium sp. TA1]|uniref:DNA repair protein RadA n=1 Tax=Thermodesulfobacterium sp. TA1 TaxID=2234087 RepID=UPI0012322CC8|nr:DNA repair protein RadA [Thermodesulfobacterium sp. TA1]QER41977.1 DNA repair protein RadA [Thermodesulfobacterium sp. TA1]
MAYFCQECGYKSLKWLGRCPECGSWNTLVEEKESLIKSKNKLKQETKEIKILKLSDIRYEEKPRILTGISEFDLVLGGGIVPGSFILIGGDPGIGKSTLLTQVAGILAEKGLKVVYLSAEESAEQVKLRVERLGLGAKVFFVGDNNLSAVIEELKTLKPDLLIVDSIQTVFLPELESPPGGVSQIRECANVLMRFAKEQGVITIVVGHITKGGIIAGPKVLEHLVDVVLYLEGEKETGFRLLRAVKNRFGPVNEIGVFLMTSKGLAPHAQYEDLFLSGEENAAIFCVIEGTRPLLVEVQSLVAKSFLAVPRRTAVGFDPIRLSLLVAILEKKFHFNFTNQDIYVKVSGGLKITDPSADMAVAVSLVSSLLEKPLPPKTLFIGEVGLSGEIRPVRDIVLRLKEAEKKGIKKAFVPERIDLSNHSLSLEIFPCKRLIEVCEKLFR